MLVTKLGQRLDNRLIRGCKIVSSLKFVLLQLPHLLSGAPGHNLILACNIGPDAAATAKLQQLVESTTACIMVVVISMHLITNTQKASSAAVLAAALQDLPTPQALAVLQAPARSPQAQQLLQLLPEPSTPSMLEAVQISHRPTLAEVTEKVKAVGEDAMRETGCEEAQLAHDEPLIAAGLTSAGAVQVVRLLEQTFGIALPDTLAFDYPTVSDMAAHILSLTHTAHYTSAGAAQHVAAAVAHVPSSAAVPYVTPPAAAEILSVSSQRDQMLQLVLAAALEATSSSSLDAEQLREPLMDAGLNSAGAVHLVSLLEAATGLELPATLAFDYPAIPDITKYLLSLQPAARSTAGTAVQNSPSPIQRSSDQHGSMLSSTATAVQAEATEVTDAQSSTVSTVLATVRSALGMAEAEAQDLSLDTPLMDAGLNSTLAIQVTSQLESALRLDLPGTLVFDYPSVRQIATFVQSVTTSNTVSGNQAAAHTSKASNASSGSSSSTSETLQAGDSSSSVSSSSSSNLEALQAMVSGLVAGLTQEAVDVTTPLVEAGMTSASAVQLTATLEEAVGIELPGTLTFDYPTIASLASYLASCHAAPPTSSAATEPSQTPAAGSALRRGDMTAVATTIAPTVQVPAVVPLSDRNSRCDAIAIVSTAHRTPRGPLQPSASTMPVDRVTPVPLDRWDLNQAALDNPSELNAGFGAFVSGADEFDPAAFHLSSAEATLMDPQQRLLLQTFAEAHHTVTQWDSIPTAVNTSADTAAGTLAGGSSRMNSLMQQFGVYVGVSQLEYARITYETAANLNAYYATGAHLSVTSGRIAYTFGLKGPALAGACLIYCSAALIILLLLHRHVQP